MEMQNARIRLEALTMRLAKLFKPSARLCRCQLEGLDLFLAPSHHEDVVVIEAAVCQILAEVAELPIASGTQSIRLMLAMPLLCMIFKKS